jgi:SAM-dependent methyltransferase
MSAVYMVDNEGGPYNSLYERPATKALLANVSGQRVLEVGCGPGALTEWLLAEGAKVTAFDVSPEMVRLARARVGDGVDVRVADLAEPLSFVADGSVDVVVASLVLHYLRNWVPVLAEFRRVLAEGGRVVFSTHHPSMDWQLHSPEDYFAVKQVTETWTKGGQSYPVTFWRRPLTEICDAISQAGFIIERIVEPAPADSMKCRFPRQDERIRTRPWFLFFQLRASPGPA